MFFAKSCKNHQINLVRGYDGWQLQVTAPNGYSLPMTLDYRINERGDLVPDVVNWFDNAKRSIDMRLAALGDLFADIEPQFDTDLEPQPVNYQDIEPHYIGEAITDEYDYDPDYQEHGGYWHGYCRGCGYKTSISGFGYCDQCK